jgi:hypothetical protein
MNSGKDIRRLSEMLRPRSVRFSYAQKPPVDKIGG